MTIAKKRQIIHAILFFDILTTLYGWTTGAFGIQGLIGLLFPALILVGLFNSVPVAIDAGIIYFILGSLLYTAVLILGLIGFVLSGVADSLMQSMGVTNSPFAPVMFFLMISGISVLTGVKWWATGFLIKNRSRLKK